MIQDSFSGAAAIWPSAVIVWSHCTKQQQTIDQQGQTGLSARLFGAFCPFRLGLRQQACTSKAKKHLKIHH